jgi:hypothetical protein
MGGRTRAPAAGAPARVSLGKELRLWRIPPDKRGGLAYRLWMEFSIKSCLSFGWETFKKRPWFFIGASVVIAIVYLLIGAITSALDALQGGSTENPTLLGALADFLLTTLISMGVTAFYLAAHDNPDTVDLNALWHPKPFWNYLAASILLGLVIVAGFILLIIPGIIFALMFMFTTFIVIDRELGPIDAMKESKSMTRGYKWQLLGFGLVLMLINLVGAIALLVGLLVTVPVTSLAFTHAYRLLQARAGAAPALKADATL